MGCGHHQGAGGHGSFQSVRGQWNLFTVCCQVERKGVFSGFAAANLRKKWRELAQNGFQLVVRLVSAYKRRMKERASDLTLVESGVHMCRALPDSVTMKSAIRDLSRLVELGETAISKKLKVQKKQTCPEWAEAWKPIFGDHGKLLALLDVATAISPRESGFLSFADSSALVEEAHQDSIGVESTMKGRPQRLQTMLLRYLPVLSVRVDEGRETLFFCAKPPQAHDHILQFATLARLVRARLKETEQRAKELPILKYLRFLSTEQDRRVFKGLLAQLAGVDFVIKQYKWKRESVAAITEELAGIDFYMADLDRLLESVSYQSEPSAYRRRKQRTAARAEIRVSRFMLRKGNRGGGPSKLLEHACCLGQLIERAVENLRWRWGEGRPAAAEWESPSWGPLNSYQNLGVRVTVPMLPY